MMYVTPVIRPIVAAPADTGRGAHSDAANQELQAIAAELAVSLGQIDLTELTPGATERVERALAASKQLTRLVQVTATVAAPALESAPEPSVDLPDLVGYRVLISARDDRTRSRLGQLLTEMGARYDVARDVTTTRAITAQQPIDLAVIDAGETPSEAIAQIGALLDSAGDDPIPVLALTANPETAQTLRDAGADIVLETTAQSAFWQAISTVTKDTSAASDDIPVPTQLVLDDSRYRRLIEIAGEDGTQELLERLLEDLRQVERGLLRALDEPNSAEIRTQTHVLIALAGAVGADVLQRQAETLNSAAHRREPDDMRTLGEQTLAQLSLLIQFIAQEGMAARRNA